MGQWGSRLNILMIVFFVFFSSGCGEKMSVTVTPASTPAIGSTPSIRLAILPLADYTVGSSPDNALRRQVKLTSAIAHELARRGIYTAVNEDVIQCLLDMGIINLKEKRGWTQVDDFLARERAWGWSDAMYEELKSFAASTDVITEASMLENLRIGLDKTAIKNIGRELGVDFVLRGRIVEYEVRDKKSFNPVERGLLPFIFDVGSTSVFGVARSDKYDLWHELSIGALTGALIGPDIGHPFTTKDKELVASRHPRFSGTVAKTSGGFKYAAGLNSLFWGGTLAGASYLASKGGKVPEAVVQIALALQETQTGRVLWANRVEIAIQPESVWSDPGERVQMDHAVEAAASLLVTSLYQAMSVTGKGHTPRKCNGKMKNVPDSRFTPGSQPESEAEVVPQHQRREEKRPATGESFPSPAEEEGSGGLNGVEILGS